jgi:hypothetical protein
MIRNLFLAAVAVVVAVPASAAPAIRVARLVAAAGPRECGALPAPRLAIEKFMLSQVVVAGKVASIEKDAVEATGPYVGAKDKQKYMVAVVKIDAGVLGAEKMKEIKIGFVPWPKRGPNDRPLRTDVLMPELKEGQEWLFYLAKHPTADFYVMPVMNRPTDMRPEEAKKELDAVKRYAAVVADPLKGLKSDKPEVRSEAAAIMLLKYRLCPGLVAETEAVAIDAEESKLILRGLAESDWRTAGPRPYGSFMTLSLFGFLSLGLTERDGWVEPVVAPEKPGAPRLDRGVILGDAFGEWLKGAGKNYTAKKLVPKKTDK